jgi:hypothetical protein
MKETYERFASLTSEAVTTPLRGGVPASLGRKQASKTTPMQLTTSEAS